MLSLTVGIIYQHGNIMVLITKFERPVLPQQLCSEGFLIGRNVFLRINLKVGEERWGTDIQHYEDKGITCRIGVSDYRAWVEKGVKRELAALKNVSIRKNQEKQSSCEQGHAFTYVWDGIGGAMERLWVN